MASAGATVAQAVQLGMDVSGGEFALHEAESQLTQARTCVHSFSAGAMQPIIDEGLQRTRLAKQEGQRAVHEFHFRRQELWVTLGIIGALVVGLLLMIRELERRRR